MMAIIAMASISLFSGCKKFLDREPLVITADDINVGAMEGQALGLYGAIRNSASQPYCGDGFQSLPYIALNGFRSDDAEIVADPGASAWHQTYDNFQYTKDDWGAGLYWDKHYILIGLCNEVIDLAVTGNYTDAGSLINVAEAKFFRAYAYFDLVRTYGDVPKINFKINTPTDAYKPKSPASEIYALIDEDLSYAEQYLPPSWEVKFKGRLTKWAAKTLHAKSLLYQKQYQPALDLCREVIDFGPYRLAQDYWKIFKKEGELNEESIFEIQASKQSVGRFNIFVT